MKLTSTCTPLKIRLLAQWLKPQSPQYNRKEPQSFRLIGFRIACWIMAKGTLTTTTAIPIDFHISNPHIFDGFVHGAPTLQDFTFTIRTLARRASVPCLTDGSFSTTIVMMSSLDFGFDYQYLTRSSSSFQSTKTHHLCYRVFSITEFFDPN